MVIANFIVGISAVRLSIVIFESNVTNRAIVNITHSPSTTIAIRYDKFKIKTNEM